MSWVIRAESDQLKMGVVVEKEHADTIKWLAEKLGGEDNEGLINEVAAKIAEDHLKEMPDYYTRLKKMEAGVDRKAKEQCSRCSYVHNENSDRDDNVPLISYDGLRLCPKCLEEAKKENE